MMDAKSETRRDASETPRRGSLFDDTVIDRRSFVKGLATVSALPFLATGCRRFGLSREAQLAGGAPVRIAIIGCGDWGRTLLNRAGASDRCALVTLSDPDPKAIADLQAKCAPVWGRAALEGADAPYQAMDMWKVAPSKVVVKDVAWGCEGAWNKRAAFDFTIPLVKTLMLSNMLVFAGKGTHGIEGDRTTSAVANAHAKMTYRTGWNPLA